jgi:hypothetical protein
VEGKGREYFDKFFNKNNNGFREQSDKVLGEMKEDMEKGEMNQNDYLKSTAAEVKNTGERLQDLSDFRNQLGNNLGYLKQNGDTDNESHTDNESVTDSNNSGESCFNNSNLGNNSGESSNNSSTDNSRQSPMYYVIEQSTEPMDISEPDC